MQFYNLNDISNLQLIRNILIFILLGHIFISDFLFQIIPDEHLILLLFVNIGNFNFHSLLGGACGFFPFFLLTMLTYLLIGNPAIGFGDIKLLSVLGLLTAPTAILAVQILASTLSGVFCMGILIYKFLCKIQKDKALANATGFVPLAPFIIFAFAIIYSL
ncbi:MAG: prepilin peptidase [Eubacteriales bacterium]